MMLELGAGDSPHPDSDVRLDIAELSGIDVVHDIDETPWPFEDNVFEHVYANHVFEHLSDVPSALSECCRIVSSGGKIEFNVPLGLNQKIDPTHKNDWSWGTPEFYCRAGVREYYYNFPIELINREIREPVLVGPAERFTPVIRLLLRTHGAGDWVSACPFFTGELNVVYKVVT